MGNIPSVEDMSDRSKYRSFPGSAFLEKTFCGSIDTTDPSEYEDSTFAQRLMKKADLMCVSSPQDQEEPFFAEESKSPKPIHPSSAMLAKALVSEVTDNPKTMKPEVMAERERQLIKAQQAAKDKKSPSRPVGTPGAPAVWNSLAYAVTGDETVGNICAHPKETYESMMGTRAVVDDDVVEGPYSVTIGLSLARHSEHGHPETITRQTAFDFNELQDRELKYVSSTDALGWRAGGGENGKSIPVEEGFSLGVQSPRQERPAAPDVVHIPIIQIDCQNDEQINQVIHALASGEIFIPHMSIMPEALSISGNSPPDLVVRFGCERNEDSTPDEWPNWCLEFMHNQLYEYFYSLGARWMKRPFSVTLARKVKWKTVKHMNRYFSQCEKVIEGWRSLGPQTLDPQAAHLQGGATPDEADRPHGVYLMRKGICTNYFAPNFAPPYTTKMTRSLLTNVLAKSWDKKRQEWSSEPIPRLVTPNTLMAMACGCTDPSMGGYLATEATRVKVMPSQKQLMEARVTNDEKTLEDERTEKKRLSTEPSPSEMNQSVAAMSGTTVMHANNGKKVYSDEDWGEETVPPPASPPRRQEAPSADEVAQQVSKVEDKLAKTQINGKSHYVMQPSIRKKAYEDNSMISLDYSTDGSSAFFTQDGSTLLGQHYADGSASVATSKDSRRREEVDDGSALSIQESVDSVQSYVPSDEELFAVGWAKALDANSGNYYYFTLDRKKIVWDNPLASSYSPVDAPGA